jgi:hypothetical protein
MMEGFLTKGIIAGLFITLFGVGLFLLFQELAVNYNSTISTQEAQVLNQYSVKSNELQQIAYRSQELQSNASIDQSVTDFAQLQGVAAVEQQKKDGFTIFGTALQQIQNFIPFDPIITRTLIAFMTVMIGAAVVYLIIGRVI